MQHIIIGTAGHIDHGKTTLIKALTGRETDTLKEEKDRGISINLGFTYFDLPSGRRAGIIDVPGHERFIKNMLAGIGGIDIVLLVIAADEGVMPQTREHLNILELLDIKKGIIVITKKDMVDNEWLNMVKDDIKNEVSKSFLKNAPMIEVSSITREGLDKLTNFIDSMTEEITEKDMATDFRVPIDRVFTISGFGTVVTGTLISGSIREGDNCEIYPNGIKAKIRGIQVHEETVKEACAGQRVAINIAGIKTDEVERGNVLSKPDSMENTLMLDCRLRYLQDASKPLINRERIRLYHGTSEILGRVVVLDKVEVDPGESALIQIRLEKPLAARRGDKYIIRSYSPMHTIGGGTILEPNPVKHKLSDEKVVEDLLLKETGTPEDVVEQTIEKYSSIFPKKEEIIKMSGRGISQIDNIIVELKERKKILEMKSSDGAIYIHRNYLEHLKAKASNILDEFHKKYPLKAGILKEEFRNKIFDKPVKQKLYDEIINLLNGDIIEAGENYVWRNGFKISFDLRHEEIRQKIYETIFQSKFQPPRAEELLKSFGREEKTAKMVFDALVDMNELIKINDEIYITSENLNLAKELVKNFLAEHGEVTAAQFRDIIQSSRKYTVAILEYFDSIKLTKRIEDKRILL